MSPRRLCILGATGSVGQAALEVAQKRPDDFSIIALAAGSDDKKMAKLCRLHKPAYAVLYDKDAAQRLKQELVNEKTVVGGGQESLLEAAAHPDCCTVIAAIAGGGGAAATLAAAKAAKRILLANKEALILCGQSLIQETEKSGGELLPIDSEHCSLFEMMANKRPYRRLWLTASGGALRDRPLSDLPAVKPQEALQHPTWSMGKKITIDSATLMNKSLEILEAAVLFAANAENIAVIMHPQSIVHAFLEHADGGMTAQLSVPDMKLPIARMLDWPHITPMQGASPDWESLSRLSFFPPDEKRYPCLRLAYRALAKGNAAPAILSAANEAAVTRFLKEEILFTDIARINEHVLEECPNEKADTLEDVMAFAETARLLAETVSP